SSSWRRRRPSGSIRRSIGACSCACRSRSPSARCARRSGARCSCRRCRSPTTSTSTSSPSATSCRAARSARPCSTPSSTLPRAALDAAAQAQLRGDLTAWAERTRHARLTLDVLVLPPDEKAQIEEIIAAGRNRAKVLHTWGFNEKLPTGKGLVVLLSGEPGTGKTLAAEVIASELNLSLYRVNPAKVVSKYVGETEKNLNEILAQAKSTHAILFFDEADALFSTRVAKVETANDRFVNMETNFLLQQLERYEGIVILATNLETSIDQAFK